MYTRTSVWPTHNSADVVWPEPTFVFVKNHAITHYCVSFHFTTFKISGILELLIRQMLIQKF